MSKNVLICGENLNDGGVETVIVNDAIALKKMGFNPYVLAENGIYTNKLESYGVNIVNNIKVQFTNGFDMERANQVINIIKQYNITEVHIHKFIDIPACIPACVVTQTPYVIHLHAGLPNSYDWVLKTYSMYEDMLKIYFENAYKIIAITENVKKYNKDLFNIPEDKYVVIYNSLDIETLTTNSKNKLPIRNFLLISRLSNEKEKSIINGINLFKEYNKKVPESKMRIAGSGNAENVIQKYVEENNIQNIEFIGRTEKIREEMENSDIVLGMGRCIVEAMAAKRLCCIIGYDNLKPIVKKEILEKAKKENFSGRGLRNATNEEIITNLLNIKREDLDKILEDNYNFVKENFDINKNVYWIEENTIDVNYKNIILDLFNMLDKSRKETKQHIDEKEKIWEGKVWLEEQYHNWMKEANILKEQLENVAQNNKKKRFRK